MELRSVCIYAPFNSNIVAGYHNVVHWGMALQLISNNLDYYQEAINILYNTGIKGYKLIIIIMNILFTISVSTIRPCPNPLGCS